ncbi:hypothetical protein AHAS_Ahas03G0159800 [Arachis hypogaea]
MVLPEEVTDIIHTIKAPNPYVGDDFISWLANPSGNFSVKSAYDTFYRDRGEENRLYKHIWKAKLPQRLKSFSWLITHDALLTNFKRKKRGLTDDGSCPRRRNDDETLLHVLRDCPFIRTVWNSIVDSNLKPDFFNQTHKEWLERNLLNFTPSYNGTPWTIIFITTCNTA